MPLEAQKSLAIEALEKKLPEGYRVVVYQGDDELPEDFAQDVVNLELEAFGGKDIGERVEGGSVLGHPREVQGRDVSHITHIGIYAQTPEGEVLSNYLSFFKIDGFIFEESIRAAGEKELGPETPNYVFRKILAADWKKHNFPPLGKGLNALSPLQRVLLNMIIGILKAEEGDYLMETVAQESTVKLVNSALFRMFITSKRLGEILLDEEIEEYQLKPDAKSNFKPHKMLLWFKYAKE